MILFHGVSHILHISVYNLLNLCSMSSKEYSIKTYILLYNKVRDRNTLHE